MTTTPNSFTQKDKLDSFCVSINLDEKNYIYQNIESKVSTFTNAVTSQAKLKRRIIVQENKADKSIEINFDDSAVRTHDGYELEKTEMRCITLKRNLETQEECCEVRNITADAKQEKISFVLFKDEYYRSFFSKPLERQVTDSIILDKAVMISGNRFAIGTNISISHLIDPHPIPENYSPWDIKIYDIELKQCVHSLRASGSIADIICLENGSLASVTTSGIVEIWNTDSGKKMGHINTYMSDCGNILSLSVLPNYQLAIANENRFIVITYQDIVFPQLFPQFTSMTAILDSITSENIDKPVKKIFGNYIGLFSNSSKIPPDSLSDDAKQWLECKKG